MTIFTMGWWKAMCHGRGIMVVHWNAITEVKCAVTNCCMVSQCCWL